MVKLVIIENYFVDIVNGQDMKSNSVNNNEIHSDNSPKILSISNKKSQNFVTVPLDLSATKSADLLLDTGAKFAFLKSTKRTTTSKLLPTVKLN
jgi:hypothetical protein